MWWQRLKIFFVIEILFGSCEKLKFVERINQDNLEVNSLVGSDFKFDCRVSGTPEPNVTWTKDDSPLTDVSYRSFGPAGLRKVFVLNLKNLLVADSGRYKCTANNGDSSISTSLKLIIKENSPRIRPTIESLTPINPAITVGESIMFSCSVQKVKDFTPFIKWERYTISKVKPTTRPNMGNTTNTTTPKPIPTTTKPPSKHNLTLNVERLASIKYVVNGMLHQITDMKLEKSLRSELVISSASEEDTGAYKCVAFNEIGVDYVVSYLNVQPEPPLSAEELEKIYISKYGSAVNLPFSLAAVVVIPVCLIIILVIGCVWWHSNEQRLEEQKLELEKQRCADIAMMEDRKVSPRMIPVIQIQSTTSDSMIVGSNNGSEYAMVTRNKASSDASVYTPDSVRKIQTKEPSVESLTKSHGKSANIKETDDKAKLLVEDRCNDTAESAIDDNQDQTEHPLA